MSSSGNTTWTGRATLTVAAATCAVLVAGLGPWSPAAAAAATGSSLSSTVQGYVPSNSTCRFDTADAPGGVVATSRVGAPVSFSRTAPNRALMAGSRPVGFSRAAVSAGTQPTLVAGGLRLVTGHASGSAEIYPVAGGPVCGSPSGEMGSRRALVAVRSYQPVPGAAWLDLTLVNQTPANPFTFETVVANSAGARVGGIPQREVATTQHLRIFVPARSALWLEGKNEASARARRPLTATVTSTFAFTFRGVVTPIGAASTAQSGPAPARRAVTLPAAVSCSARKATVRVTRYARKKARTVVVRVNGTRVRTITRPTARKHVVKVPARGGIRIKATVTFKNGKKKTTSRSYAACR